MTSRNTLYERCLLSLDQQNHRHKAPGKARITTATQQQSHPHHMLSHISHVANGTAIPPIHHLSQHQEANPTPVPATRPHGCRSKS